VCSHVHVHVCVHKSRTSLLPVSQIHLGKDVLLVLTVSPVIRFSAGKKRNRPEHGQVIAYKEMLLQNNNNNSGTLFSSGKNYLVLFTPVSSSFPSSTLLLRIKKQALHEQFLLSAIEKSLEFQLCISSAHSIPCKVPSLMLPWYSQKHNLGKAT